MKPANSQAFDHGDDYSCGCGAHPRRAFEGKWVPVERLARVALTGLARKILRKAEIIAGDDRQV
jgi:hypothetical protein